MKLTILASTRSRLLLVTLLAMLLFTAVVFSKDILQRIQDGISAQAAIAHLDAIRHPLLKIKTIENQMMSGSDSLQAVADIKIADTEIDVLLADFIESSRYNEELLALVEQFAECYQLWIAKELWLFQHIHQSDKDISHNLEHLIEADKMLLDALDILSDAEKPIHDDISDGSLVRQYVLVTGAGFIFYLFLIIYILQNAARRKLAEREENLYTTLRSIGDAVISTDIDGHILQMNPVAEELTGWSHHEAKGKLLSDVFIIENANSGETVANPVDSVLENGAIVGLANHTVLRSRNGGVHQITDSTAPIKNNRGKTIGVVLVFHDVTESYRIQQQIEEQASRLHHILEGSMDAIIAADENSVIVEWNTQAEKLFGWSRDEIIGATLHETIIPERYRERHLSGIEKLMQTGESSILGPRIEISALNKYGDEFPVELSISQPALNQGHLFSAFVRDLTETKLAEQELKLAATTFYAHSGIVITDQNKRILRVNPAMEKMSGYTAEEMIGEYPSMLKSGRQDAAFYKKMWLQIKQTDSWQGELWNKRKDGGLYAEFLTITAVKNQTGEVTNYIGTINDITERKDAEEKIQRLAYYDDLTELANRRLLIDRLNHQLLVAKRHDTFGSLLYLDLDRFKNLNDALGHPVGDELLRQVAARLKQLVRSEDTVSRLGGDEFVIMLPAANADLSKASSEASNVADKTRECLSEVFDLQGYRYHLDTSIGIVVFPDGDEVSDDILKHADSALYRAKGEGRNTSRFYKPSMQQNADERLQLEKDIRHALENSELVLDYQPQVGLDGHIFGAEALLRWHHPKHGIIPPAQFIPLAEETGLILDIGNWVIKQATEQVSQWHKAGVYPDSRSLAINVSPRQFHQANFVDYIIEVIDNAGVSPGCIELEITESLLMDRVGDAVDKLNRLREHGIKIAIDDFGTGFSSLSYLKKLPLDKLKIDQSFVRDVTTDANDAAIVETIIAMAKHMNLKVIAEGVETDAQLNFLKSKGCEVFQGYFFSKPVSAENMIRILKNNSLQP